MTPDDRSFVIRRVTWTLCAVVAVALLFLLVGLFDPKVDNKDIFAILNPAIMSILGYLGGLLTNIVGHTPEKKDEPEKVQDRQAVQRDTSAG